MHYVREKSGQFSPTHLKWIIFQRLLEGGDFLPSPSICPHMWILLTLYIFLVMPSEPNEENGTNYKSGKDVKTWEIQRNFFDTGNDIRNCWIFDRLFRLTADILEKKTSVWRERNKTWESTSCLHGQLLSCFFSTV